MSWLYTCDTCIMMGSCDVNVARPSLEIHAITCMASQLTKLALPFISALCNFIQISQSSLKQGRAFPFPNVIRLQRLIKEQNALELPPAGCRLPCMQLGGWALRWGLSWTLLVFLALFLVFGPQWVNLPGTAAGAKVQLQMAVAYITDGDTCCAVGRQALVGGPVDSSIDNGNGQGKECQSTAGSEALLTLKDLPPNAIVILCGTHCPDLLRPDTRIIAIHTTQGLSSGTRDYPLVPLGELASSGVGATQYGRLAAAGVVAGCCAVAIAASLVAGCLVGWLLSQRASLAPLLQRGQGQGQQAVASCSSEPLASPRASSDAAEPSSGGSSSVHSCSGSWRDSSDSCSSTGSRLAPLVIRRSSSFEDDDAALLNNLTVTPGTPLSSPTRALAARLFSRTPNPQWLDTVVSQSQIEFCHHPDGRLMRLGGGASGSVFKVILHGHTVAACKVFEFSHDLSLPQHFVQEAQMLRRIRHPNVLQFYGVSATDTTGMLLMELMDRDLGSAFRSLARSGERLYGWYARGHRVALQIACGLAYLHSKSIVHMDLKLSNVLVTRDGNVKIADVGLSRLLRGKDLGQLDSSHIGTWEWCAPEVLLGERACEKADIFSYGILLWALITGEEPRRGHMPPLACPQQCPPEVVALQAQCVERDPALRPSAADIVEMLRVLPRRPSLALAPHNVAPGPKPAQVQQAQQGKGKGVATPPGTPQWAAAGRRHWPQLITRSMDSTGQAPSPFATAAAAVEHAEPPPLRSPFRTAAAALGLAELQPLPSLSATAAAKPSWEAEPLPASPLSPLQALSQCPPGAAAAASAGSGSLLSAFGSVQWAALEGPAAVIEQDQPALPSSPQRLCSSRSAPALAGALLQAQTCGGPPAARSSLDATPPLPALSSPVEQAEAVYCSALAYLADA